jgi:hypothetical protein
MEEGVLYEFKIGVVEAKVRNSEGRVFLEAPGYKPVDLDIPNSGPYASEKKSGFDERGEASLEFSKIWQSDSGNEVLIDVKIRIKGERYPRGSLGLQSFSRREDTVLSIKKSGSKLKVRYEELEAQSL